MKKTIFILIGVVVLVVIGWGGWWYYTKFRVISVPSVNTGQPLCQKIGELSPVSEWISISSQGINEFNLKYPPNWVVGFGDPGSYTLSGFMSVNQHLIEVNIGMDVVNIPFTEWQKTAREFKDNKPIMVDRVNGIFYIDSETSRRIYLFPYKGKTVKINVFDALEIDLVQLKMFDVGVDKTAEQKANDVLGEIVSNISWK